MASISTLFYVLENLEHGSHELYDVEEIFRLEQNLLGKIYNVLDQSEFTADPKIVKDILRKTTIP